MPITSGAYDQTGGVDLLSPEKRQYLQGLMSGSKGGINQGLQRLSNLAAGDEATFQQMEAPAYTAFNKTLGQIGTRFSGFGGRDSSAFQNAVSGAGAELSENMAAKRQQLQMQAIERLLGLSSNILGTNDYEAVLEQKFDPMEFFGKIFGTALGSYGGKSF